MSLDLARIAEVQRLLATLAPLDAKLLPNEREMVAYLRAKYAEPAHTDADDAHVLAVIARNVGVRSGFDVDPGRDSGRVIDVRPKRPSP